MSRSGYNDDCDDHWSRICYRGAVSSAMTGKRGQALLREALEALDTMPVKELADGSLVTADGAFCTLGAVGAKRGIDLTMLDPEDPKQIASAFDIAPALAREIVYMNDEYSGLIYTERHGPVRNPWDCLGYESRSESPAERWVRMRAWIAGKIEKDHA